VADGGNARGTPTRPQEAPSGLRYCASLANEPWIREWDGEMVGSANGAKGGFGVNGVAGFLADGCFDT